MLCPACFVWIIFVFDMKLSIFILAAGLGEGLRPITDYIPKPLIPILGKPVLQSILERISSLPVDKIGINLHHKKEVIKDWIKKADFSNKIEIFPEDPILGTGGALKNAESFLCNNTFLVHNSDIISDIDLEKLVEFHLSSKNLLTLAVHDYPEFNKLLIDENGFLKGMNMADDVISASVKRVAFTGIAVYSPEFLKFLPSGVSSVVDAWIKSVESGYKVGTFDVSGCYWNDIGRPATYAQAVLNELKKNGETVYIHPSVKSCKDFEMDGYVVIEEQNIFYSLPHPTFDKGGQKGGRNMPHKNIFLRNCIMLPGSHSLSEDNQLSPPFIKGRYDSQPRGQKGLLIEDCILGPGFKIDLNESEVLGLSGRTDAVLIGIGGSDREYYRVRKYKGSAVFMKCLHGDKDFHRHIEYTRFFKKHSIPVPELIDGEPDKRSALFEDLGDLTLYSWLKCPREQEQIEKIYKKVIDMVMLIHTGATKHISECPLLENRVFDYEHLRWETGYFIERFVEGVRNKKVKNLTALNDEFHRLALKVDSFTKTVIHRDFQSQNIMITKGEVPRLVDYQGARIGPPAYDVVSLLWDPYFHLDDNVRQRLLDYYINEMSKKPGERFNKREFRETLLSCRLQRHMQALGAYGFLSSVKGKKHFLKYIPEGLRVLKDAVSLSKDDYPELFKLVVGI
jgi:aminoglycoside/choline kinase family phosphotransferase/dTDP-glucose pyrophosphorylase